MIKKLPSPFFVFNSIKCFEKIIFESALLYEEKEPLISILYFWRLKNMCQKEIDRLMMKNNLGEIFKYLDNIDDNSD